MHSLECNYNIFLYFIYFNYLTLIHLLTIYHIIFSHVIKCIIWFISFFSSTFCLSNAFLQSFAGFQTGFQVDSTDSDFRLRFRGFPDSCITNTVGVFFPIIMPVKQKFIKSQENILKIRLNVNKKNYAQSINGFLNLQKIINFNKNFFFFVTKILGMKKYLYHVII